MLNVSVIIMATKRSTLGLCKDFVLAKQFGEPLWVQKNIHQWRSGSARKFPSEPQISKVCQIMLALPLLVMVSMELFACYVAGILKGNCCDPGGILGNPLGVNNKPMPGEEI